MCWPTCKGGAYLAVSVFVYRAVMVVITMISSSITRYKMTYLPITVMEELLLQLIYFIPLFTSSCFILIGLESNSFNYMFYSTLALGLTLFVRYTGEITYIYAYGWDAYRLKLPQIYLYLGVDVVLLFVLMFYARNRLRSKRVWKDSKDIYECEMMEADALIHNDLMISPTNTVSGSSRTTQKNVNANVNVGEGVEPSGSQKNGNVASGMIAGLEGSDPNETYYHYPPIAPIDPKRAKKPLPPLPKDELDDVSLPPPVPLAYPDDEDDY